LLHFESVASLKALAAQSCHAIQWRSDALTCFPKESLMASVNKVILVGNCGRDPEVRYLPSGGAVASVTVATSSRRKDRNSGETIEDTQWHRVTFFERLAEIVGEYVKKGSPIYIEGRLRYSTYTDKTTGVEKNSVEIVASEMQLLGGREARGGGGDEGGGGGGGYSRPASAPRPAPAPRQAPAPAAARPASGFDDMDDDIPF
jgi:single-strand DNA-binding protein